MKKEFINPFTYNLPTLDLHGVDRFYAKLKTNEFISDNYKLNNKKIIIIHGIGKGIIKESVHEELKRNKIVKKYYFDNLNIGQTLIELQ